MNPDHLTQNGNFHPPMSTSLHFLPRMLEIETYPINIVTTNTPNSKYPVLVYRNVLTGPMIDQSTDEAARKEHIKQLMEANNWRPEVSNIYQLIFGLSYSHSREFTAVLPLHIITLMFTKLTLYLRDHPVSVWDRM